LQGLILSNALRAQKDAEDEGCAIALSNLRFEVIELRNEGLEKDKILHSLINRIKENEATFKSQRCYIKSIECVKKLKASFASVGAFSSEENFTRGNPEDPIEWIDHEAEAFEEILNSRGDICAFSGATGIATILEKKGCEHIKILAQSEAALSFEDASDPSAEASMVGGKIFTDIWDNGGREMAREIIRRSEKGIHDAREVAEAAEKSAEPEGQLGIN
jgi:hypothetical protein